ncbi:Succinyl-diaminopimelate desuccinylase [Bosea sp. 62]|uniref:M20 family metallopeptidase n=1 Tax=unclassified Bosea (in: a-proteobacteria) TaxID=2653178 RepID=UPI001257881B|nr:MULTISPECIES: M20/M25/M40 family metallo-hydrolase [unclassified Bosea (in: a-proteobacteria)]CAD5257007.1 Succinyl-diaminopimelate desuccinylase [Bosea sp. 46]CAD5261457.1 Succinyl-diaminopimelate desuccinylase [Bosea sp. 21B]CAD5279140.1 Succinyl-diaminopimelate desuccinylase [Bosea sp. 7B]VVT58479.1 Succinyl-diaminopimelate desuccinylase [Bosea sp. EC-HK365B]VXB54726.1 Succinyl-diaminopimelate desuccinylase [Bosea sp. 29B]
MSEPASLSRGEKALAEASSWIADNIEGAVAELGRMIAVDTSFPPGLGYDGFAGLMEELVAPLGFATERVTVPESRWKVPNGPAAGPRTNLIASRASGRPVCGLYFHVDTVPAAAGWESNPLVMGRDGDCLIGLGAADMKGCIAAILLALRAARACGVALAYDPMLLFCTDEEGGLYPGIRYLAEQGNLPGHILNFNGSAEARIWAGCFGLFNLLVRIHGQAVHAGEGNRKGSGLNAIEGALPLLNALMELKAQIATRTSALPPPPGKPRLTAQLNLAAIEGGTAGGQVPALLELTINRRYAPEERFEAALAEIEAVIHRSVAAVPGLTVETALVGHLMPTADPAGPHWLRWQAAMGQGFGYAPEDFRRWGAASCSDFGWVQRATGQQEVLLGGLGRPDRNIHSPGEYTTVPDIVSLAQAVLSYLAADFRPDLNPDIPPSQS